MQYSLSEIITRLGGTLSGTDVIVHAIAPTNKAQLGELTFLTDKKYIKDLNNCQASAIIISAKDSENLNISIPKIISDNPYLYYSQVVTLFHPKSRLVAGVKDSAKIGKDKSNKSSDLLLDGSGNRMVSQKVKNPYDR